MAMFTVSLIGWPTGAYLSCPLDWAASQVESDGTDMMNLGSGGLDVSQDSRSSHSALRREDSTEPPRPDAFFAGSSAGKPTESL